MSTKKTQKKANSKPTVKKQATKKVAPKKRGPKPGSKNKPKVNAKESKAPKKTLAEILTPLGKIAYRIIEKQIPELRKIYIAGQISNLPEHEYTHLFQRAEDHLVKQRYHVLNPLKLVPAPEKPISEMNEEEKEKFWKKAMGICIETGVFECDEVYMLKNWQNSRGARIEFAIAKELGKKIIFEV